MQQADNLRKVFLLKANAGQVEEAAVAMKHQVVFLGSRQVFQEWRQVLVQAFVMLLLEAGMALLELDLLRVKHNANKFITIS